MSSFNFNLLALGEVESGLSLIFDDAELLALAQKSGAFITYGGALATTRDVIAALPQTVKARPFAGELDEADQEHDDHGESSRSLIEAYIADPGLPAELRAKAQSLSVEVVPKARDLRASYAEEVRAAKALKGALEKHADDLKLFGFLGGRTLYELLQGYVAAAEAIDVLLAKRGAVVAAATPEDEQAASRARTRAVSLLTQFRRTLHREAALNANLPAGIEAKLFGKLDVLAELAASRKAAAAKTKEQPPA